MRAAIATTTPDSSTAMAHGRAPSKGGLHFLERVLTCARARCSYVGCTRLRHVGPCNEHETTDALHPHRDETH
jgi:hypothetical protein